MGILLKIASYTLAINLSCLLSGLWVVETKFSVKESSDICVSFLKLEKDLSVKMTVLPNSNKLSYT